MSLFLSTFTNKIDKKGRVSLPAPFRATLFDSGSSGVVLFPSLHNSAIEGWSYREMERLVEKIDAFDLFSDARDDYAMALISRSHHLLFDPEGRIGLPEALIAHASLTHQASFVGRGKTFQMWHPGQLQIYMAEIGKRAREKVQQLPGNAASPKEASDD